MENQALKFIDEQKRNRYARILVFACFFMYVMMMGSKNAYTAEVVAIQDVFGKNKTEVSLAMTFYFVTYAIMQVILASFMGRLNLKIYLTVTVLTSSILTVLIAYSPTLELIYLICAVNGALQAGVYSGCMAVLSKYLPKSMLPFANTMITLGSAVAGGISYGVPALCVSLGRWDMPFIVLGIIFFVSGVIFFYACSVMSKFPPLLAENNSDSRESKVEK